MTYRLSADACALTWSADLRILTAFANSTENFCIATGDFSCALKDKISIGSITRELVSIEHVRNTATYVSIVAG